MYRSAKYLDYIRAQPCLVCGGQSVAHHEPLGLAGMGIKAPDTHCIPLCHKHHRERHDTGKSFYVEHRIDPMMEIIKLLTRYMEEKGL